MELKYPSDKPRELIVQKDQTEYEKIRFGQGVSVCFVGNYEVIADPILENNTWGSIGAICDAGKAPDFWAIGDEKTDVGTDGTVRTFRICDMSGMYGKRVVFEAVDMDDETVYWLDVELDEYHEIIDSGIDSNVYESSTLRTETLPEYYSRLSLNLRSFITETTYKVSHSGNDETLDTLTDKLFLASERETMPERLNSSEIEFASSRQFQYYENNPGNSYRAKLRIGTDRYAYWFLRSPRNGEKYSACGVAINGMNVPHGLSAIHVKGSGSMLVCLSPFFAR